jgi:hypothetical protein
MARHPSEEPPIIEVPPAATFMTKAMKEANAQEVCRRFGHTPHRSKRNPGHDECLVCGALFIPEDPWASS